ncbi:hypothetical protein C2G38_2162551 [Gigaspora rosea]|uniref:Protein kinase domain-containing protein n=1 Tax=Gigaspora rosea TaxID=44941 RepID=A0A397W629_9GLOM|nr:hypothetical protein C2G38_2162551 [Gigaspora rosea]
MTQTQIYRHSSDDTNANLYPLCQNDILFDMNLAVDIYNSGVIMAELSIRRSPHYNIEYDEETAIRIYGESIF